MSGINQVMEEIKKTKAIAEMDAGTDVQTRRIKMGRIRQAKERLENLYMEYRKALKESTVFILAVGSEAEKFAEIASKDFQCFSVSSDSIYQQILDQVPEKLYLNKIGSRSFFDHLSARFEDRAHEIDIIGYPPLYFDAKYKKMIQSKEDALRIVKDAFNEKIGSEIVGLDAIEKVAIESVNKDFKGTVVPIILYTQDEKLTQELLEGLPNITRSVFTVKVGKTEKDFLSIMEMEKVTKDNVKETLISIKKKLS